MAKSTSGDKKNMLLYGNLIRKKGCALLYHIHFPQSLRKYLEVFGVVSLDHKWNGTMLLSIKTECVISLKSCQTLRA